MKKIFILFLLLIISSCATLKEKNSAFLLSLGSENVRLRGNLARNECRDGFKSLTYEKYLDYLKEKEVVASKGLSEKIKESDDHYFETTDDSFAIGLVFYKKRLILYDDAHSSKIIFENDTGTFDAKTKTPLLSDYVKKAKIK